MKSIAHTNQTTTLQLAIIAIAVGMLGLAVLQFSANSLLFHTNHNGAITGSSTTSIKLTKNTINLENEIVKNFGDITRYFNAVSNVHTANLLIPNVKHFSAQLDHWIVQIDKLAVRDQASVALIANENLGSLVLVMNDVMNMPGVAPVLEPTVTQLMRKLSVLVQTHIDVAA